MAGASIAQYSAGALISLIGRNEEGLVLSREVVAFAVNGFRKYFDYHDPANLYTSFPAKKVAQVAQSLLDMVPKRLNLNA